MKKVTFLELYEYSKSIGIDYFEDLRGNIGTAYLFCCRKDKIEESINAIRTKYKGRVTVHSVRRAYAPEIEHIAVTLIKQRLLNTIKTK